MYSSGIENESYLRGVQVVGSDGVVSFTSIFPAATTAGGRTSTSRCTRMWTPSPTPRTRSPPRRSPCRRPPATWSTPTRPTRPRHPPHPGVAGERQRLRRRRGSPRARHRHRRQHHRVDGRPRRPRRHHHHPTAGAMPAVRRRALTPPSKGTPLMLQNLTGWHALIALAVIVLIFGAAKLPALARSLGQSVRILKTEVSDSRAEATGADPQAPAPARPSPPHPSSHPRARRDLRRRSHRRVSSSRGSSVGRHARRGAPRRGDATGGAGGGRPRGLRPRRLVPVRTGDGPGPRPDRADRGRAQREPELRQRHRGLRPAPSRGPDRRIRPVESGLAVRALRVRAPGAHAARAAVRPRLGRGPRFRCSPPGARRDCCCSRTWSRCWRASPRATTPRSSTRAPTSTSP